MSELVVSNTAKQPRPAGDLVHHEPSEMLSVARVTPGEEFDPASAPGPIATQSGRPQTVEPARTVILEWGSTPRGADQSIYRR